METNGTAVNLDEPTLNRVRRAIELAYEPSRERSLAFTKLDECELWLTRCKPRGTEISLEEMRVSVSDCLGKPADSPFRNFCGMAVE